MKTSHGNQHGAPATEINTEHQPRKQRQSTSHGKQHGAPATENQHRAPAAKSVVFPWVVFFDPPLIPQEAPGHRHKKTTKTKRHPNYQQPNRYGLAECAKLLNKKEIEKKAKIRNGKGERTRRGNKFWKQKHFNDTLWRGPQTELHLKDFVFKPSAAGGETIWIGYLALGT